MKRERVETFNQILHRITQPALLAHPLVRTFLALPQAAPGLQDFPSPPNVIPSAPAPVPDAVRFKQSVLEECTCRSAMLIRCALMRCCRLTGVLMTDPVMGADGYTYEKSAITRWLLKVRTSSVCGMRSACGSYRV